MKASIVRTITNGKRIIASIQRQHRSQQADQKRSQRLRLSNGNWSASLWPASISFAASAAETGFSVFADISELKRPFSAGVGLGEQFWSLVKRPYKHHFCISSDDLLGSDWCFSFHQVSFKTAVVNAQNQLYQFITI